MAVVWLTLPATEHYDYYRKNTGRLAKCARARSGKGFGYAEHDSGY
jgi:hypothetical protein